MNSYPQKSLHNPHAVNVYHILEPSIIQYMNMRLNLQELWEYARIDLIHMYSYESMPAKDQKSEFILGYKQMFIHSKLLREELRIGDQ